MTTYTVNGTVSFAAWITVEASDPEAALLEAMNADPRDFDFDGQTAEVVFNVDPTVEEES